MNSVRIMEYLNGEFKVRHDIIDDILLSNDVRNRKIVVMSIIGEYRKGKSFFLGYCLKFLYANYASTSKLSKPSSESASNWLGKRDESLKGFSWRHGSDADTKGVLIWPDVFLYDKSDDEKIAIILMDTQGLFEIGSTQDENARIFGLSILTSSIQVINLKDVIQENQIEYLDMATSFTKCINQKLSKDKKHDWKAFQSLLFLIRDWQDEEIEGGLGHDGGETYLNKFLKLDKASKSESIRKNIRESFDSIKCFLLNHPGLEVSKKTFKGEWSKLDKDFVKNLSNLIESLLKPEKLIKKSILGKDVTGEEFRDFLSTYLQAFRDAKLPDMGNIFQLTIENQMKALVAKNLHDYQNAMNENFDFSQEDFECYIDSKHENKKTLAIYNFSESDKMEEPEIVLKFQNILKNEIEESFKSLRTTVMRDYQQYLKFTKQIKELNQEKEKQNIMVKNLEKSTQEAAKENARMQQDFEKTKKELQEQTNRLSVQMSQKDEEMKKIREEALQKQKEHELKMKQKEDEQNKKIQEIQEMVQEARDREEKLTQQYEKDKARFEEERENDRKEFERNKNEILEKMESNTEEQNRQYREQLEKSEKEFNEREEKRKREEVKIAEERKENQASTFPIESICNLLTAVAASMPAVSTGVYKSIKYLKK